MNEEVDITLYVEALQTQRNNALNEAAMLKALLAQERAKAKALQEELDQLKKDPPA